MGRDKEAILSPLEKGERSCVVRRKKRRKGEKALANLRYVILNISFFANNSVIIHPTMLTIYQNIDRLIRHSLM